MVETRLGKRKENPTQGEERKAKSVKKAKAVKKKTKSVKKEKSVKVKFVRTVTASPPSSTAQENVTVTEKTTEVSEPVNVVVDAAAPAVDSPQSDLPQVPLPPPVSRSGELQDDDEKSGELSTRNEDNEGEETRSDENNVEENNEVGSSDDENENAEKEKKKTNQRKK